jgi:steroid delta-isomerase-like uncharacterized protein
MKWNRFHPVWMIAFLIVLGSIALIFFGRDKQDETAQDPGKETVQKQEDSTAREPEDVTVTDPENDQPTAHDVVAKFIEAYNSRDTTALKSLFANPVSFNGEEFAPDVFIRNSWVDRLWQSFPDARIEPTHFVATDEYVMLRTDSEVTGQGTFLGLNVDGKTVRFSEMSLYRVEAGKITEWWYEIDMLGFWEQLGHIKNPLAQKGLPTDPRPYNSHVFHDMVAASKTNPLE